MKQYTEQQMDAILAIGNYKLGIAKQAERHPERAGSSGLQKHLNEEIAKLSRMGIGEQEADSYLTELMSTLLTDSETASAEEKYQVLGDYIMKPYLK